MHFRIYHERKGGHVHMRVFVGAERDQTHGKAGDLCMAYDEFDAFCIALEGAIEFADEGDGEEPRIAERSQIDGDSNDHEDRRGGKLDTRG